jgi:Helicase associated domain
MFRKGKLSEDRVQRLGTIGFIWCLQGNAWNEMYRRLVRYKAFHGDCNVPSEWVEDPQLGSWVVKQRHRRKKGLLKEDRVRKLDTVGMKW